MTEYAPDERYPDYPILYDLLDNLDIWDNFIDHHLGLLNHDDDINVVLKNINAVNVNDSYTHIRFKSEKDIFLYKLKFSSEIN